MPQHGGDSQNIAETDVEAGGDSEAQAQAEADAEAEAKAEAEATYRCRMPGLEV